MRNCVLWDEAVAEAHSKRLARERNPNGHRPQGHQQPPQGHQPPPHGMGQPPQGGIANHQRYNHPPPPPLAAMAAHMHHQRFYAQCGVIDFPPELDGLAATASRAQHRNEVQRSFITQQGGIELRQVTDEDPGWNLEDDTPSSTSSEDLPSASDEADPISSALDTIAIAMAAIKEAAQAVSATASRSREARKSKTPTYRPRKEFPETFQPAPNTRSKQPGSPIPAPQATPSNNRTIHAPSFPSRPSSYHLEVVPSSPTLQEYMAALKGGPHNSLTYFRNSRQHLERCIGLATADGQQVWTHLRFLLDTGANVNLISEALCIKLNIAVLPTEVKLSTSIEHGSAVVGITPPLALVYGVGLEQPLIVFHYFLVTKGMDTLYQVLVSNLDMLRYGAVIDNASRMVLLRPHFAHRGVQAPTLQLDICQLDPHTGQASNQRQQPLEHVTATPTEHNSVGLNSY